MLYARGILLASVLAAPLILTTKLSAYDGNYGGYYQPPYSYRELARTGKYHGYWRDQGYGVPNRGAYYAPYYTAPYYSPPYYAAPYGGAPAGNGGYYHPPRSFPFRYQY